MPNGTAAQNETPAPRRNGGWSRFALVAGVLLAVALASGIWSVTEFSLSNLAIDRERATIIDLERLLSSLKDVETGQRGFLLTGQDDYLGPYREALPRIDEELRALSGSGVDLDSLNRSVAQRLESAALGIQTYRTSGQTEAVGRMRLETGKAQMDNIRALVAREQSAADARIRQTRQRDRVLAWPVGLLSLAALAGSFTLLALLTLRRRREQRASSALLEGVLENAPVGLGFLDEFLRVRHMNRALSTMSDRALSAEVGVSIWDVVPHMREAFEPRLRQVVDGGRPMSNVEIQAGSNLRRDQVRDYQVSFYPLRSVDGGERVEGAGMVVADITARKRTERWLRESEERFRTLTEASAAVVWTTNQEGEFDKPQPEWSQFTGQAEEASRGLGFLEATHPEDRARTGEAWAEAVKTKAPYLDEYRLRRTDGEWRFMVVRAVPILDEDESVREWVGMHTDITDRKTAELELAAARDAAEAANRAKSVFLANMSHELRTPLSAVIGYSEMMEEEVEDLGEASLLADLGKIKSNARHLLSLINDVLDLSKIEANRMDTFAEDVDVATLVNDVASTVDTLAQQKDNRLDIQMEEGLGTMHTDVVKLRQCLFNLLSNASKFTESGRITLATRREGGEGPDATLVFRVIDTGIGMTAEQLSRLFQRFSQADETTTRKFGGTGLGLAITRAFSRLLGGTIAVESTFGSGTTFTIRLPATMPDLQIPEEPPETSAEEPASERNIVLVIDDDPSQRDLMARFLERQGFAARTAPDGPKGLDLARTIRPRAILLDVMMPQMDGWSVLSALKEDPELAKIPVIMVTFVDEKGLSATLGAADHVNKPVNWDKLKKVMDRLRDAEGDILVVDDDPDVRYRLRTVLERNGWTVQEAGDGQQALAKVVHGPPRAILLDLTMPVMDGFAFLHALRERPGCENIPVLVFSARDISAKDREQLREADRVLSKSVSLRDLTGELRALVPPDGQAADAEAESKA